MGVFEARGTLNKSMKELMLRWAHTRSSWDDAQSEEFQKEFLEPLERDLRNVGGSMDTMAQLLSHVRRECS